MIIWLASFPRSGNTFFRMLLRHKFGVTTYSVYNDPMFDRLGASEAIGHELLPGPVGELASAPELYFVKTHDLPPDDSPAIYIVRDGRDALVSLARYNRSFGRKPSVLRPVKDFIRFDRTLQQAILSDQYGGWSGNVNGWVQRKNGNRTYIIRYEELVKDPGGLLSKALQHFDLAIEPTGDALPDFGALHQKWPDFFRKGKTGSWREEMSEKNHSLFWQHHAKAMDLLGYAK